MDHNILASFYIILGLGIFSQWLSWRIKIPAIIPLLFCGFLVGPILGIINSRELLGDLFLPFVEAFVPFIVFEGALGLKLNDIRLTRRTIFSLSSIGVLITFFVLSAASYFILNLSYQLAFLFGSLMVITGPTVILPMLRQIRIKASLSSIIRWEGILIEPIGVLLVSLTFQSLFFGDFGISSLLIIVLKTVVFGILIGFCITTAIVFLFQKHYLPEYLHEAFVLACVLLSFLIADALQSGAGLVTVVLMGILLANQKRVPVNHIVIFKENLRVLAISILFVIIASSLTLDILALYTNYKIFLFLLVVIFISRPLTVFISCFRSGLSFKEKLFLSWIAPRGIITAAAASLFSLQLLDKGIQEAEALVPLTFIVIVGTVAVYGLSAGALQKLLNLQKGQTGHLILVGSNAFSRQLATILSKFNFKLIIIDSNKKEVEKAKSLNIKSFHRNIFSFHLWEELQILGIDYFLALTRSDEVNVLCSLKYQDVIGPENVYQLRNQNLDQESNKSVKPLNQCRELFNKDLNYSQIETLLSSEHVMMYKTITKNYTIDTFKKENPQSSILFIIQPNKQLKIYHNNKALVAKDKDVIIYITDNIESLET